ncbi:MAG: hypothetical protein K6U10_04855 [Acidobacteriia bacterium]|nr:hypothetical protein [Methyloceanibacter sp.]MCL6491136.1 hypothetical protein [Terriglobia bacterium]
MSNTETPETAGVRDEIAELRRHLERLLSERVEPQLARAADTARTAAEAAGNVVKSDVEAILQQVRAHPVAALAVAAGLGFLIGRVWR